MSNFVSRLHFRTSRLLPSSIDADVTDTMQESMALFGYPHSTCQYDPSETALAPSLRPTPAPPIGNITNQLRNGVRFLDLRFSLFPVKSKSTTNSRFFVDRSIIAKATSEEEVNSSVAEEWELRGYHGIINQKITAIEAFEEIYQFLDAAVGRGETIIVSIKQVSLFTPYSLPLCGGGGPDKTNRKIRPIPPRSLKPCILSSTLHVRGRDGTPSLVGRN